MAFRVAGAAETEAMATLANEAHELGRIAEAVGRAHEAGLTLRWIAAQGQDVFDSAAVQAIEDRRDLVAVVADAGEVGHRFDAVVALDARDDVDGLLPRTAAGTVGDRHEARLQRAQVGHRAHERLLAGRRLGRKELEGEDRFLPAEQLADPHNRRNLVESRSQGQCAPVPGPCPGSPTAISLQRSAQVPAVVVIFRAADGLQLKADGWRLIADGYGPRQ